MRENRTSGSMRGCRKRAYATRLCSTLPAPRAGFGAEPQGPPQWQPDQPHPLRQPPDPKPPDSTQLTPPSSRPYPHKTARSRKCHDAGTKTRYLIIVSLFRRTPTETAAALHIARSTVYRVAARFRQFGEWGLLDRREDNGQLKLSEHFLAGLDRLVRDTRENYGWPRPSWTRELLVATLRRRTASTVGTTRAPRVGAASPARLRPRNIAWRRFFDFV
jgi:hypothetical protein